MILVVAVLGMVWQVHATGIVSNFDFSHPTSAGQLSCGVPLAANHGFDLDNQRACDAAVAARRAWVFPLIALGLLGLAGSFVRVRLRN
ncbi:hypothetical protein FPZ12_029375 [Amycolatopsis acidicola]|uniref:Uncharacterized protein n=1 Tax=Amycolatopsis acidicola TaxID=2596893 RepID=A0A5N0UX49_9PSEU|nr:hypothetical protein [Amycolatopsis acidicola]KAA9155666.1 hypothetical protein FPZ12_029375 [Amycolatopsis acidicola]